MTPLPPPPTFNRESVVPATTDGPVAAAAAPLSGVAAGPQFQSSDGGTGVQPFVHAEAAWEVPAPRNISGKQEGRTGFEVGTEQTPGSPMLSARTLPIPAEQAPGPSEAFVLVERSLLESVYRKIQAAAHRERLNALPAFLRSPVFPDIRTRA